MGSKRPFISILGRFGRVMGGFWEGLGRFWGGISKDFDVFVQVVGRF